MAVIAKDAASTATRGSRNRIRLRPARAPLLMLGLLLLLAVAVDMAFAGRVLPRVTVAGIDVGGASGAEVGRRLEQEVARPWAAAAVALTGPDGARWVTTNGALAVLPDVDRAVDDALAYGRTGSLADRLGAWVRALGGQVTVPLAMRAGDRTLDAWIARAAGGVDRPAADGSIVTTDRGALITDPIIGRDVDRGALRAALLAPATLGDRELSLTVRETYPAVDESGIRRAAAMVRVATAALTVSAGDRGVQEDAAGLASLLVIEKVSAAPGDLDAIPSGAVAPPSRYLYRVRLDDERVKAWIVAVAVMLDRPAKNATYTVRADGSFAVVSAANGVRIDQAGLLADVTRRFFEPAAGARTFAPAFVNDTPVFSTEQAQRYAGAMVRISSYTTTYPANASRHANITTGAAQFNDVVIAPGATFSFWDVLGPVTTERGYAYAGAIINNRSDENVIGGGLCQVSTTLFNAVARAGYDILERHEHGYYIDRYPLGFDAAVFDPGVDFRWRNDTAYPVLIRSYGYAASVQFDLYSLPTGRRVVVGDSVESRLTSPALDQPADPAYPPGAVVQGRNVVRTRTVYEGDRVVHADTFWSYYVPVWGGPAR